MRVVVGAFIVGGILLFAGGLFLIGDRRLLFARQFELSATFGKVTTASPMRQIQLGLRMTF